MGIFFYILEHNIAPVFILIALGYFMDKKYNLNMFTLSKILIYLIAPAYIVVNLYTTALSMNMLKVLLFCITYSVVCDLLARVISKIRKFDAGMTSAFKNSIMFNNTANIGVSLITLVFSSAPYLIGGQTPYLDEAMAVMIAIMVYMNVTCNTVGFYYAGRAKLNFKNAVLKIFMMPPVYVVPITLLLKYVNYDFTTTFVWPALVNLKSGLVPIALLSLGVQLSKTKFNFKNIDAHLSAFTRLVFGPVLALLFIYLFGFTGVTAQTVLIGYSVPTAVNTALIALEFDNNKDFATQAVVVSTIFGMFTLTFVIYAARILFPI